MNLRFQRIVCTSTLFFVLALAGVSGQGAAPTAPASQPPAPSAIAGFPDIRVEVVLSRRHGQKVIGSRPFELVVTPGRTARLRVGIDLYGGEKETRFLGTSIEASVLPVGTGGQFVTVSVSDSTLEGGPEGRSGTPTVLSPIRSYSASGSFMLRDGQTTVMSLGTDPMNGEVTRADVTVKIVK